MALASGGRGEVRPRGGGRGGGGFGLVREAQTQTGEWERDIPAGLVSQLSSGFASSQRLPNNLPGFRLKERPALTHSHS
jgi:hypothetical protein